MTERYEPLSVSKEMNFFISYKWNNESEVEADRICDELVRYQINPIRDKYSLEYGRSIKEFMDGLKDCDGVILIICEEYFLSLNCMYEGISTMQFCKNRTIIRILEDEIFSLEFKKKVLDFWEKYDLNGLANSDLEKLNIVRNGFQDFLSWISDTNSAKSKETTIFSKQLKKHISKVYLEGSAYFDMVEDLTSSKMVTISKVCDPVGEEQYIYKSIDYSIQDSPVARFRCLYNFVLHLVKCDTNEETKIQINDVVGIEPGNLGADFSKYYFVIPERESLERAFFKEKMGEDKCDINFDKHGITISI